MSSLVLNSIFASLYVTCKHEFSFCYRWKSVVRVIRGGRPFVDIFYGEVLRPCIRITMPSEWQLLILSVVIECTVCVIRKGHGDVMACRL